MTTRGMSENEFKQIADFIHKILGDISNTDLQTKVKKDVAEFCNQFPLYK
jgi:glycine/serine hydroxymethyltransferase